MTISTETSKIVYQSFCSCCGHGIKGIGYRLCLGCKRKRDKVYSDCIAAGKSAEWAKVKSESVYPEKY